VPACLPSLVAIEDADDLDHLRLDSVFKLARGRLRTHHVSSGFDQYIKSQHAEVPSARPLLRQRIA